MQFKEDVWPVTCLEVTVCEAPVDGVVVVVDLKNRSDEVLSVALLPDHARDLGERLLRAYKDARTLFN